MNYKNRLRNIERMFPGNETNFQDLLKPEYVYTGRSFLNPYKALQYFGVINIPEYFSNDELQTLFEKGILSFSMDETNQAMIDNM
ncbi:MAG TPA: hypothetical protein PKA90_14165 [Ignavibacteria bacterium]|nr:hypothetical protein [Ignavibacteria bacterium]HMR41564.1 hypothetical protein [Ignavibacteria bacterium]